MATPVIMPRQGQSVESCIIAEWKKKKGDPVAIGDVLFSYETDKASFEETAKVGGTLLDIFYEEGDDVECLLNVCVIGNPGEDTSEFNPNLGASTSAEKESTAAPAQTATSAVTAPITTSTVSTNDGDMKISPRAKHLAERTCANLNLAEATGPHGRIIERDVEKLLAEGNITTYAASGADTTAQGTGVGGRVTTADLTAPQMVPSVASAPQMDYEEVKHTNIRKVIAKSMHASLSNMAQLTLNASFDATSIMNYRKVLKEQGEAFGMEKVTLNDMILFAVSRIILNHPDLNAHYFDDKMIRFHNVHLGVATDTERGLMVPTVFNSNKLSLKEISTQTKSVCGMCRSGACSPDLLKDGTFTVTNLGSLGIESFTPVINPPQTAILGVNTIVKRVREASGTLTTYPAMGLSLTFDHRAVDGAPAARFLQDLCKALENFPMLLGM